MEHGVQEQKYRAQRLANLARLKELGYEPYGFAFERTGRLAEIRADFAEGRAVRVAGRLSSRREMGKSVFADLRDGTDRFQLYLKNEPAAAALFASFGLLDFGDHIGVEGELFTTRTGEKSIKVTNWVLLSKALLPPPEKWHGLQDVELRYRQRYLDLVANPEVREVFNRRIAIVREIRSFLMGRGYQEVETPMMQPMAGGAAANPFKTRYDALSCAMFLRIAPELYLKRLLVGGFDKVFELNRNFRNEGLSRFHNPEFTMMEVYEAYGDVRTMMELIQSMVTQVAQTVFGKLVVGTEAQPIDLTPPWREVPYRELIAVVAGPDWFTLPLEAQRKRADGLGIHVAPEWGPVEVTQEIFEKLIEKTLVQPTFVTRLPVELVPLAKACPDDPTVVDVFECIIGGREVAPAYSELNDPIVQRARFEAQAGGDPSKVDEDFLEALEHGMPPAGGMGIGIDRLVMILAGAESIRDVILFPQLKPRGVSRRMRLPFSLFLALKYLRPKRTFIGMVTVISVVGVLLGVAVLVIVLSVMSGFDDMWSEKILSFNAHITVDRGGEVTDDYEPLMERVREVEGVTGVAPYVQGLVFLTRGDRVSTPVIRGVDPRHERAVSRIPDHMSQGTFSVADDEIVMGRDLAMQMGVRVGDQVLVYSPRNFTQADEMHLPEELRVSGIFSLGMWEFDVGYALTSLRRARELYRMEEGVHALQVMTVDPLRAHEVAARVQEALGPSYQVTTWMEQNRQLFDALRVEKNMMFFLLIFITIVAAFGITNTLITVAVQKTREIGLLKALGFTNERVTGVFLWQGFIQGMLGTVLGLGTGLCVLAYRNEIMQGLSRRFGLQILPKELYHLSELPSTIVPADLALVAGSVIVICTLAGVVPAWRAARLDPVQALRHE